MSCVMLGDYGKHWGGLVSKRTAAYLQLVPWIGDVMCQAGWQRKALRQTSKRKNGSIPGHVVDAWTDLMNCEAWMVFWLHKRGLKRGEISGGKLPFSSSATQPGPVEEGSVYFPRQNSSFFSVIRHARSTPTLVRVSALIISQFSCSWLIYIG